MKIVAFMPIKLNNERTPGKNIKTFSDGTPLIHFMQKTMLALRCVDASYVYCSSEAIKPYLLDGIEFLKRPSFLDSKECNATDLVASFTKDIIADIYVMVHATSPFVTANSIQKGVDAVMSGEYDSAYPAQVMNRFFWYKGSPLNFTLNHIVRTQDVEPLLCELCSPFIFTRDVFELYGARTGIKPFICIENDMESIDIDDPEDFELADLIYTHKLKGQGIG